VDANDELAAGSMAGIVALRMAKRKVRIGGRAIATAHLLHPNDNEKIDLARDNYGQFYFGGPGASGASVAWSLPRIESESLPEGTAITAAWDRAVLWDREQATIAVSDSHADFFVRNLVAILGEMRAAFGVMRPPAFVVIDLAGIFALTV
jgi:HK97 family phage major capsid protein